MTESMHDFEAEAYLERDYISECLHCGNDNPSDHVLCDRCRLRRNDELRAIMSVIAIHRPTRRNDALHDYALLLEEREQLQKEVNLYESKS